MNIQNKKLEGQLKFLFKSRREINFIETMAKSHHFARFGETCISDT
jgi:hypothetical protein